MGIQVLDRAVRILDALRENGGSRLTSLSAKARLPLSTTSRIVSSLVANGIVEHEHTTRCYRLGARLLFLGSQIISRPLSEVARPVLERLAQQSGEDAGLSILQGTHALIVDRVEGPHPLKIVEAMRQPVPLYCGAFRKVLLAYQPPSWIEGYISSNELEKFTPRTIRRKAELRKELELIRTRGYALSYGEYLPDSGGVSAPVFGPREDVQAALFIWGPHSRLNEQTAQRLAKLVVEAAADLTQIVRGQLSVPQEKSRAQRRS